jgi:hypothetical protein
MFLSMKRLIAATMTIGAQKTRNESGQDVDDLVLGPRRIDAFMRNA